MALVVMMGVGGTVVVVGVQLAQQVDQRLVPGFGDQFNAHRGQRRNGPDGTWEWLS